MTAQVLQIPDTETLAEGRDNLLFSSSGGSPTNRHRALEYRQITPYSHRS